MCDASSENINASDAGYLTYHHLIFVELVDGKEFVGEVDEFDSLMGQLRVKLY